MNNEKHTEGQVWTCQQYPTSPYFSGAEFCDPKIYGDGRIRPAIADAGTSYFEAMMHPLERIMARRACHLYVKPMIKRCRLMTREEGFLVCFHQGIQYDVYNIVEKNGFITETEFKEIVEKYEREIKEVFNGEAYLQNVLHQLSKTSQR